MPYIGQRPATGEANSFKILDDISNYTLTFGSSDIDVSADTITAREHRFVTGQRVTYGNGGGTDPTGLSNGTVYYIIVEDRHTFKLATNAGNAVAGTAINITAAGAGASHTINVAFDGVNTKFKATHSNGTKADISQSGQLMVSVNGVLQQPHDNTTTPTTGYATDHTSTIIFSAAPAAGDQFFGRLIASNFATFDISDNTVDNFTGDGNTSTFTLSKTPPNNESVLVTIDGVVQYPDDNAAVRAYTVSENVLDFASAPGNAVEIQVRHIGFAGASTAAVSGFYGRTGNAALKNTDDIVFRNANVGVVTATDVRVTGNLTVDGTTTTLDTDLIGVDKLEVAANNTTVAAAITQTGSGDILNLYDSGSAILSVKDGGNIIMGAGAGSVTPHAPLHIRTGTTGAITTLLKLHGPFTSNTGSEGTAIDFGTAGDTSTGARIIGTREVAGAKGALRFCTGRENDSGFNNGRMVIDETGKVGIGNTSPSTALEIGEPSGSTNHTMRINSSNPSYLQLSSIGTRASIIAGRDGASSRLTFLVSSGGTNIERMRIEDDGKVGIGTDNPGSRNLQVYDSTGTAFISLKTGTGTLTEYLFGNQADDNVGRIRYDHSDNSMALWTNAAEKLRITSGGDIGIGVDDPDVYSLGGNNRYAAIKASAGYTVLNLVDSNNSGSYLQFGNPTVRRGSLHFDSSSNFLVTINESGSGTTLTEKLRLDLYGRLTISGQGLKLNPTASTLYTLDGSLSYYATNNAVYLNGAGTNGWLRLNASGTENNQNAINIFGGGAGAYITMHTNNVERLRITSDGKVGINDTSPVSLFTVNNGTNDDQCFLIKNDNVGAYFGTYGTGHGSYPREVTINGTRIDGGSHPFLRIGGQGGIKFCADLNSERMRITSDGKILVGTTSSSGSHILEVNSGTDNEGIKVVSTDAGSYIRFADNSTTAQIRLGAVGNDFKIDVNASERLRIDSQGRFSIGAPASNALGALHIHANQGTDTALWIGDSSTNRYLAINEQGSSQNFNHIHTRFNDNSIHAHYILDNPYANAAGYGSQILFRGYNQETSAYLETSNEAANSARATFRIRGRDNHGLDVRSTGEVTTTHASNIGYATNAATNTRGLVYTSLDPQKRSTTAAEWYILKTFHPNKSGTVNMHAQMYITSGTYYFTFRVREEGTDTIVFNAGDNGGYAAYATNGNAVHSYRIYKWICPLIKAHKRYYIEMAGSNAAGTSINYNSSQQLFLKDLYIYSMSGGHSDSTGVMLIQQALDEGTSTNYGGTTRAAMNGGANRDSLNSLQYFSGTESTFLGWFTSRAYNRYLDFELNLSGSYMWFAQAYGYLYSRGQVCGSMISGYTYTGNQILNKYSHTFGNRGWYGSYRTSGGNLCLKFDSGSNGYTEGRIALFFGTHGPANKDWRVLRYRQNDTTNNIF